ncbi:hypothetical protein OF897_12620 [Chryseobacterium formosus]|uniref:Trimeric autotransporter adhesin YadA-like head domain-containing protein n=1 Tax=Chryseobacterium formosus TaxID=1537363 RepID=A0ABT3XTL7_9FLAO|nr:hypothetical protein [Chryseobacterium formosus]MCX8524756.1 hypothetical protein [Chryseobacterium formosus]
MKSKILQLSLIAAALSSNIALAQVGIGTTTPDNSSILHLNSTNKGLLITSVAITSATDNTTISSPATGLLIWNNGTGGFSPAGFYYWNNSQWNILSTGNSTSGGGATGGWTTNGNSGSGSGANTTMYFGTSSQDDLVFKVNNVNAGRLGVNNSASFGTGSSAAQNATAIGYNSSASAYQSQAFGMNSKATANESTALGFNSQADGYQSLAMGHGAKTTSNGETAIGINAQTAGQNSVALGSGSKGLGQNSIALGYNSQTSAYNSTALGSGSNSSAQNSLALGYNSQSSAYNSTALGSGSNASGQNSTAIGNGATTSQANAIVLGDSSANVGIGTNTPNTSTKLDVNGQYKLGEKGSIHKNMISFETNPSVSISGLQSGRTAFIDITIPVALRPNSTNATIVVSPANDFAGNDNFGISNPRMTSNSNIRINVTNITNGNQNLNSGHFFVTINEF